MNSPRRRLLRRPHFSLRTLILTIAVVAVVFGACVGVFELVQSFGFTIREQKYLNLATSVESRIGTPREMSDDSQLLLDCRQQARTTPISQ